MFPAARLEFLWVPKRGIGMLACGYGFADIHHGRGHRPGDGEDLEGPDCYSDFSQSTRSWLTSSARSCWTQ